MGDSGRARPPANSRNSGRQRPPESGQRRKGKERAGGRGRERTPESSPWDEELLTEALEENPLPTDVVAELEPFPAKVRALLGAAVLLLPEYPEEALRYASGAKKLAPRSAAVREAVGMAAYQSGDYAQAIKELRSAARISGDDALYPVIADCERGLGRPEKALEIASRELKLNRADRIEMRIVAAGARLDLDQAEEALRILQGPMLDNEEPSEAVARLKYVYAEALLAAGRSEEARDWFLRAAKVDADGTTDAVERVWELDAADGPGDAL